jgi:hypothetical protein
VRRVRRALLPTALFLLGLHVGTYLGLSRRGYDEARRYNLQGFYYFTPEPTDAWRSSHHWCWVAFWPLNEIDKLIGTGRPVGFEPLWGLSQ